MPGQHGLAVLPAAHAEGVGLNDHHAVAVFLEALNEVFPQGGFAGAGFAHHGQEIAVPRRVVHKLADIAALGREVDVFRTLRIVKGVAQQLELLPGARGKHLFAQYHIIISLVAGMCRRTGGLFAFGQGRFHGLGVRSTRVQPRGELFTGVGPAVFRQRLAVAEQIDGRR